MIEEIMGLAINKSSKIAKNIAVSLIKLIIFNKKMLVLPQSIVKDLIMTAEFLPINFK